MFYFRDHVAWHFIEELREFVQSFPNPQACWKCDYTSEKMDNLVKHVALGHSKLDELLADEDLLSAKRLKAMSRPKKVFIFHTTIDVQPLCAQQYVSENRILHTLKAKSPCLKT